MLHALERVMIRRALGFLYRRAALDTATCCVLCPKRWGTDGLVSSPFGLVCPDHFTPTQVAAWRAATQERTGQ